MLSKKVVSYESFSSMYVFKERLIQRKRQYCGWKNRTVITTNFEKKKTSSSYHMEQKTLIEASSIYNIHAGEKHFCSAANFEGLWQIKKHEVYFGLYKSSFTFIEKKRPNKYCLCKVDLICYM